jgi:glycosyltransferase involved in cell wall biosynthesis
MNVICIHPRLAGLTSHHFNEAQGFVEEFARRGSSFELLVSVHAPPPIVAELGAHPVLDDPTFRMEWSFEVRSDRFLAMLHEHLDHRTTADHCVLITVSTQLEAHALTRWVASRPAARKPWVVVLFLSDRWNRSGQAEYERQAAEFRELAASVAGLSPMDAHRLMFFAVTEPLAGELTGLIGTPVTVAPMPIPCVDPKRYLAAGRHPGPPRVAILGGLRAEKGSYLVPSVVRACRSQVLVEFLVHLTNNTLTEAALEKLACVADEPDVTVVDHPMTRPEYYGAIASADLGLFPYEVIPYRKRSSGVFAEMVSFGKPVVATRGTWLAQQIEEGRAAGRIFGSLEPTSIARAIASCVDDLEQLTWSARRLSPEWRRTTSLPAFIDLMETTVAARSRSGRPAGTRRRLLSWWPRRRLGGPGPGMRSSSARGEPEL